MPTKTIGITEEVYERLAAEKHEDESFTDTVARLLDAATADWRQGFGRYAGSDGEALGRIVDEVSRDHAVGFAARQDAVLEALGDGGEKSGPEDGTTDDGP